ncbi:hypothetical protein PLESTM_001415700 [Pleodorina starrii]|nr:hypothetical protein PLESTM_001415700 [Pleodorina starrii]
MSERDGSRGGTTGTRWAAGAGEGEGDGDGGGVRRQAETDGIGWAACRRWDGGLHAHACVVASSEPSVHALHRGREGGGGCVAAGGLGRRLEAASWSTSVWSVLLLFWFGGSAVRWWRLRDLGTRDSISCAACSNVRGTLLLLLR